jgi:hypothetical protein
MGVSFALVPLWSTIARKADQDKLAGYGGEMMPNVESAPFGP